MAVFWVGAAGNDANDGTTFANRKATWGAALALATAAGDTVNVVASDGALTVDTTDGVTLNNRNHGTSFGTPGLTIQGTDSSGVLSQAELNFEDNTTTQTLLSIDNGGASDPAYIVLQSLIVDWTAMTSTAHNKNFVVRSNGSTDNFIRIQYCEFRQSSLQGGLIARDHSLGIVDGGYSFELRYNYIVDLDSSGGSGQLVSLHHRGQGDIHHNVVVHSGAWDATHFMTLGGNDGVATDHRCYNNTFVTLSGAGASFYPWHSTDSSSTGGNATKHLHSNVHADFRAAGTPRYALGNVAGSSATYNLVMGYTLFCNPNSLTYETSGPYQVPWDPDNDDSPEGDSIWATDVSTTTDVFTDKATPWVWANINGSGVSMTLFGDLRIKDLNGWRTMALDGGVPGAIEDPVAAGPDLVVDKSHSSDFQVGEVGTFMLEVQNAGDTTQTHTVVLTDVLPAGLSYRASSGVGWSVMVTNDHTITASWEGDIPPGETTTALVIEVDVAQAAFPSVTNEVTLVSGATDVGSDSDIIPVSAAAPTFVPGNPSVLISEAAPGFPVVSIGLHLQRNLELTVRQDSVGDDTGLGRFFSAIVELPAGATDVEMPMILEPTFLMLETDQDLVIQINSQTFPLLAGGCVALTEMAQVNTFAVTNQSAFKRANLQYCGAAAITQGTVEDPSGGRGDDEELN